MRGFYLLGENGDDRLIGCDCDSDMVVPLTKRSQRRIGESRSNGGCLARFGEPMLFSPNEPIVKDRRLGKMGRSLTPSRHVQTSPPNEATSGCAFVSRRPFRYWRGVGATPIS